MTQEERFLYWIQERWNIYQRRLAGKPKPWTADPILQSYFFTMPYRELDKTTAWFRRAVRDPLCNDPAVLFATVCFRWFNWIPTGEALVKANLLSKWNAYSAKVMLRKLGRVFTGAFNISNSGSTKPKIDRVCDDYVQPAWEQREHFLSRWDVECTMEGMHAALSTLPGMGGSGFMAYEVVCDLRYTYLLENAPDKLTWSNMGPGAKRGLNRVLGREVEAPVSKQMWREESAKLLALVRRKLHKMPPFEMREVEHSLCEFFKMERARVGDGHLKRRYAGT